MPTKKIEAIGRVNRILKRKSESWVALLAEWLEANENSELLPFLEL